MKAKEQIFNQINQNQTKDKITINYSVFAIRFSQILQNKGFIHHWHIYKKQGRPNFFIQIHFQKPNFINETKQIFKITKISSKKKPVYVSYKNLWKKNNKLTTYILTTSRGIITDDEARKWSVGGKIICVVQNKIL